MPATLGHIGVQYLITRGLIKGADPKWILLGCIIPDIPWILQRIVLALADISPVAIRLYAIGQSSLGVCILLCLGVAQLSRNRLQVFATLALGSGLHLVLDAMQIKWGNGVSFWGPVYWNTVRFDVFWPEDMPTLALLFCGMLVALWYVFRLPAEAKDLRLPDRMGAATMIVALLAYGFIPLATMTAVQSKNLHFTDTIAGYQTRAGQQIEIDRNHLQWVNGQPQLSTWFGETLLLSGNLPDEAGKISLVGRFEASDHVQVFEYHTHRPHLRDVASILGLLFVLGWWLRVTWQVVFTRRGSD